MIQKQKKGTEGNSPEAEIVLSALKEQELQRAVEETMKDKVEGLNRLKEGIKVLQVEIGDKNMKKEELAKMYEDKMREVG